MSCGQASRWGCPDVDRFEGESGDRDRAGERIGEREISLGWGTTEDRVGLQARGLWSGNHRARYESHREQIATLHLHQLSPLLLLPSPAASLLVFISVYLSPSPPLLPAYSARCFSNQHVSLSCTSCMHPDTTVCRTTLSPRRTPTTLLTSRAQNTWQPHCQSY